jgi:DNA-binding NarL/FixJ family response regulator
MEATRKTDVWFDVVVVDPDHAARAAVARALARLGLKPVEAQTGEQALALTCRGVVALVVAEVRLPDMSGFELCRELREQQQLDVPVVLLSGELTDSASRVAGLLVGADEYLVKPFDPDELRARARNLVRRFQPTRRKRMAALTPREQEVLTLLAEGLDQHEIAQRLVISPRTVSTHLERILGKTGARTRAQAVTWAFRHQLVEVQ